MAKIAALPRPDYNWTNEYKSLRHEPLMLQFVMMLRASGYSDSYVATKTGITPQTLRNWRNHKTRRPNSSTLRFAGKAIGKTLKWVDE